MSLNFRLYGEATPALLTRLGTTCYIEGQVLGDWFPGGIGVSAA